MASQSSQRDQSAQLAVQLAEGDERAARAETKLRIEHEWRSALQATEVKCKEQIAHLQQTIQHQQTEARKHDRVRAELDRVRTQWSEAQTTLEELGIQLSVSKLQVSELQDAHKSKQQLASGAPVTGGASSGGDAQQQWAPDRMSSHCRGCNREFSITRRKVWNNTLDLDRVFVLM